MDEPSNSELQRSIERNHKDLVANLDALSQRMERYVLERVYMAEMNALQDRLRNVEKDADTDRQNARAAAEANRQTARNAIFAALGTLVAAIILAALSAWIKSGGTT